MANREQFATDLRHRMGDQSRPSGVFDTTRGKPLNATIVNSDANWNSSKCIPNPPEVLFGFPKARSSIISSRKRCGKLYLSEGYQEVRTPLIYDSSLWQTSGHWEHFKDDMFLVESEDGGSVSALKPMNCPAHMLIYKSVRHSYRDLPYRLHDQGVLHRNEATGTLTGLSRVRQMCQDDAHNFVTEDQIADEYERILGLFQRIYGTFDLPFRCDFSTRNPEKFYGRCRGMESRRNHT